MTATSIDGGEGQATPVAGLVRATEEGLITPREEHPSSSTPIASAGDDRPTYSDFESGRAIRATLIDLQIGAVMSLIDIREGFASFPSFSADSGWLTLSYGPSFAESEVYRADFSRRFLQIERVGPGVNPAISPDGSAIALLRFEGDSSALHPWSEDGTIRRLVEDGVAPSWSPDGRWLAFRGRYLGEDFLIDYYLMDAETGTLRVVAKARVCHCDGLNLPSWTRDGRFALIPWPADRVGLLPLTGEEPKVIPPRVDWPIGSPGGLAKGSLLIWRDNDSVASAAQSPAHSLELLDLSTGVSRQLVAAAEIGGSTIVSPDGTRVAYESKERPRFTALFDTASGEVLADHLDGYPADWSADGRFLRTNGEGFGPNCAEELALFRAEDGDLVECLTNVAEISWSPVGASFVYTQRRQDQEDNAGFADLMRYDAATGETRLLARDLAVGCFVVRWSPDGRFLTVSSRCQL